jgi:hypothetical protein
MKIKKLAKLRELLIAVLAVTLAVFSGCDRRPTLTIEGGAIPVFKVNGEGSIAVLTVSGPDFDNPNSREAGSRYMKPYWQIVPGSNKEVAPEKLGSFVYGQVPDGFRQVFPENGAAPRPLKENELFTFDLRLVSADGIAVRFVIRNGQAVVEKS